MKRDYALYAMRYTLCLSAVLLLSGCVVRSYKVTKERIDQDLASGNRGYLKGQVSLSKEAKERKTTRITQVVEVELHSPIKFEKTPKAKPVKETQERLERTEEEVVVGNRGYITQSITPEIAQTPSVELEKYRVQKGDTLQKISQKFYGTTKKWTKIYDANKDTVKGPNKIYPGQLINIPQEALKETEENLN